MDYNQKEKVREGSKASMHACSEARILVGGDKCSLVPSLHVGLSGTPKLNFLGSTECIIIV